MTKFSVQVIILVWIIFLLIEIEDALKPPQILPPILVVGNKATVCWIIDETSDVVKGFQLTYEIVGALGNFNLKLTRNIDGLKRSYTIRGLIPLSTYKIFMVTIGSSDVSNASATEFTTDLPENRLLRIERSGVYPEEIIFIAIVVVVWVIAVIVFLKQWNSIRILEPVEPRYKHAPKNLENIRVVKRTQDSVIYKGYSRKLSITMVEREKRRLQRMNTAPVLPVTGRMTLNTLPTIQMEDMTTEM
ncbi:uncharacterized protein LOC127719414 [Mytilus californianus]|uniref:uncharacterized protein LOC127719414 n=1 Tax=Mytilus californianus TaxID=6549 RepID=UPI0022454A67|nr:uncharacterized protein LOC127719414 [Mytilus californianus]